MSLVDIIKNCNGHGLRPSLSFFRDSNQKEIDLIIEFNNKITPIEIKASQTIDSSFFDTPTWFKETTNSQESPIVIYGGDQNQTRTQGKAISWKKLDTFIDTLNN